MTRLTEFSEKYLKKKKTEIWVKRMGSRCYRCHFKYLEGIRLTDCSMQVFEILEF